MAHDLFEIELSFDGPQAMLKLAGELDMGSVPALEVALGHLDDNIVRIIIDLSELQFLDSSGISGLLRAQRHLPLGAELWLRSPRANVRRLLEITGADHLVLDDPDTLVPS